MFIYIYHLYYLNFVNSSRLSTDYITSTGDWNHQYTCIYAIWYSYFKFNIWFQQIDDLCILVSHEDHLFR